MPLQNRVDPWGNIVINSAKGTFLGNRGILHNENQRVIKTHQHQSWVTCRLSYKGRKRVLMSPGQYTELFFLDEATAFAAGHRPCSECRRDRFAKFKAFWVKANLNKHPNEVKVAEMNKLMHKERINRGRKVTFKATYNELPDGTFFSLEKAAYIIVGNKPYLWSFDGYSASPVNTDLLDHVDVLTPESIVNAFRLGFKPSVHESIVKT